jgi:cytochrome P450
LTHFSVLPGALIDHQAKKRMARLIQRIIQEKRRRILCAGGEAPPQPRDAIDVLMGDGSDELTDELISDNMIDLMIPAEDSVPMLITLAVKFLSECPLALQQLEVCITLTTPSTFSIVLLVSLNIIPFKKSMADSAKQTRVHCC